VAAGRGLAVPRELDEIELVRDRDRAREVGDEEERPFQRRDEDRVEALVVAGDLGAELGDARLDLLRGQVRLADLEAAVYWATSSRNRWARRSMSRR
jgi:hypothetical protein